LTNYLNDVEPFIVYVESPQNSGNIGNLHPLAMGKKLFASNVDGISEIKWSNKNRVVCLFKTASEANAFVHSNLWKMNNLNVYIPRYQVESLGLVRNIDTLLTEEEIM